MVCLPLTRKLTNPFQIRLRPKLRLKIKINDVPQEQSTSQVTSNQSGPVDINQGMFDKMGALFKVKTKAMSTDIKSDMTNKINDNAKEIKSQVVKKYGSEH